jgi:hypothetical protein
MIWAVSLVVISGLAYIGQFVSAFWPIAAARLGLTEPESDVDATFYADGLGEAYWDILTLWTLPAAGVLMLLDSTMWPIFGLVGGGTYLYFAGRGIAVRLVMRRRMIRIGDRQSVAIGMIFLGVWGLVALVTIIIAVFQYT